MIISVFGLGYVGTVSAACLSSMGYEVIGVDIEKIKINKINQGISPITEPEVDKLIADGVASGSLKATNDVFDAVIESDLIFITVGTPSLFDGSLDLSAVLTVIGQIGKVLKKKNGETVIVVRSTVLPGTTKTDILPLLEEITGKPNGETYKVLFHPEFLREGNAVEDFFEPPKIVIGEGAGGGGQVLEELYKNIPAKVFRTSYGVSEAVKYADNAFHALKITFANELGQIFSSAGIDSREVMNIFKEDRKLNISPRYLQPGFAFGGSCLPKDLRAMMSFSKKNDLKLPMLEGILPSNDRQIRQLFEILQGFDSQEIGLVGIAFKPGTDDLRESPLLKLAALLVGSNINLRVYDPIILETTLIGSNKDYLNKMDIDLSDMLVEEIEQLSGLDVVILAHPISKDDMEILLSDVGRVIDLVGVKGFEEHDNYQGLFW